MGLTRRAALLLARAASAIPAFTQGLVGDASRLGHKPGMAWTGHIQQLPGTVSSGGSCGALLRRGFASGGLPPHSELGMPALSPTMSQVCSSTILYVSDWFDHIFLTGRE